MQVSVIIPAHNAASTLGAQLSALASQDIDAELEVLVVDNGSDDATRAVAEAFRVVIPGLRVLDASPPEHDQGPNPARQVGALAASGDLLLFCDADDVVCPGWARSLVAGLSDHDAVGGAMDLTTLATGVAPPPGHPLMNGLDEWDGFLPFAWTSNLGVRAEVFHSIGGFDASYLRGGDDVEFSWRLQLDGHRLGFAPAAVVHYSTPRSAVVGARKEYRYCQDEPRLYAQFRPVGMPPGRPLGAWGAVLVQTGARIARNPRDVWARGELLVAASRLGGLVVGSVRHRRWYLGRPV